MNKLIACLIIGFVVTLFSCKFGGRKINGNGKIATEKRAASSLSKVKVAGGVNVVIDNGLAGVRVEADENLIPYIVTETDGDWFKIRIKDDVNLQAVKTPTVYISTPAINSIKVAGNGEILANGKFSSMEQMYFDIAGSGSITIEVNAPGVETEISGSGSLHISGETRNAKVDIAGSGNYDGISLKAENANVSISGSGEAIVFAETTLKASIAGSGNIKYKGNAAVDKQVAGSGEVVKIP